MNEFFILFCILHQQDPFLISCLIAENIYSGHSSIESSYSSIDPSRQRPKLISTHSPIDSSSQSPSPNVNSSRSICLHQLHQGSIKCQQLIAHDQTDRFVIE
uniref:Uncharacterized protein n=1 Tax=Cacopsylla melanoneura TaxID=428564 RepID=A0A8D8RHZ2_9HEMI